MCSSDLIAQHYGAWVDHWVIDNQDAALAPRIAALGDTGKRVLVTDTLMTSRAKSAALARRLVAALRKT